MLLHIILRIMFIGACAYVGLHAWHAWKSWFPGTRPGVFFLCLALPALPFVLEGQWNGLFSESAYHYVILAGMLWLGFTVYACLVCLILDLALLANRFRRFLPDSSAYIKPASVFLTVALLLVTACGFWNSRQAVTVTYDVNIQKPAGGLESMRIVLISDLHAGQLAGTDAYQSLPDAINALEPDIVLIPGDLVDHSRSAASEASLKTALDGIHAPFGVYACPGNNEYQDAAGQAGDTALAGPGNVIMLNDQAVLVDNRFYVAGRSDPGSMFHPRQGASLKDLLQGLDADKPVLLLDHRPERLDEAAASGVDLQVSGHTHAGQLWPMTMIGSITNRWNYGYYRDGDFQTIVTSGLGVSTYPIRVGTHSEIALIVVHFE